jgi:hypothetical protein
VSGQQEIGFDRLAHLIARHVLTHFAQELSSV